ncbi:MAG: tyrosine-protein phosphatase [Lachnospiraceae bacterium]|nr:tyrosine-protein phosphatase [Lachnospiraceae bacterium]
MKDIIINIIHLNNELTYGNMYMGLYFLALIFLAFVLKDKRYRNAILWPSLCLLFFVYVILPVFNFLDYKYIKKYILGWDMNYRMVWLLLVVPVIALFLSLLIKSIEKRNERIAAALLLIPVIFFCGQFKINGTEFAKAENLYKLPRALLDISDTVLSEKDEPKLLVPYETAHVFRQYSSDIKLLYGEDATYGRVKPAAEELVAVCNEMTKEVPDLYFINEVAEKNGVDYIIFDAAYHRFGGQSVNVYDYSPDPDYIGDRSVAVSENRIPYIDMRDEEKESIHWDLSEFGLSYEGTYGQYLLYRYDRDLLTGAGSDTGISTGTVGVREDTDFGNVIVETGVDEFNDLGFKHGDSLDVRFSNGYTLEDIPYYSGYYNAAGEPLLVEFMGKEIVAAINYGSLWSEAGLSEGDTAEISLNEAGKYLDIQNALDIAYTDDRNDYDSDVVFANFRSINAGKLKENILCRSASPCDNKHNRARYCDDLAEKAGIGLIVDLADSHEEIKGFMSADDFDSPCFASLYERDAVIPVNLQVNYKTDDFRKKITEAFRIMSRTDGPYLIHCVEGKDRTGFVCALLECLAGASYDEIVSDYMESYINYYGLDPSSERERYDTILDNNLVPMLRFIAGAEENADITAIDLVSGAEAYLLDGGMTREEIEALKEKLCGPEG